MCENSLRSLIDSVASSNLETFHSKAIAWTLNSLESVDENAAFFCWLFEKATGRSCEKCEHLGTVAEVSNCDMVTTLKVTDIHGHVQNHLIVWENKIKADFSQKTIGQLPFRPDKLKRKIDAYGDRWLRGISQPYWYQIRWLLWKRETDNNWVDFLAAVCPQQNDKEDQQLIEEQKKYPVHWLILSPFDQGQLEIFYESQWQGNRWEYGNSTEPNGDIALVNSLIDAEDRWNNWRFCTYRELSTSLQTALSTSLKGKPLNEYVDYMGQNLSNSQQLYSANRESDWTPSRLLEVHEQLKDDKRIAFFWSVGGSSNSSSPLLNISMRLGGEFEGVCASNDKFEGIFLDKEKGSLGDVAKSKVDFIQCSIQIQGTVKLQFAHRAYDHVRIRSASAYIKAVHSALGKNDTDGESNSRGDRVDFLNNRLQAAGISQFEISKENRPKTKTGLSYSVRIKAPHEGGESSEIKRPDEIVNLVDLVAKAFIKN